MPGKTPLRLAITCPRAPTWMNWRPPGGDAIALSQQDVTVLHVLMAEPERIVSRQQIVQSLGENFLLFPLRMAVDKPVDKCCKSLLASCGKAVQKSPWQCLARGYE